MNYNKANLAGLFKELYSDSLEELFIPWRKEKDGLYWDPCTFTLKPLERIPKKLILSYK